MTVLIVAVLAWIFWGFVALGFAVGVHWILDRLIRDDREAGQVIYLPARGERR